MVILKKAPLFLVPLILIGGVFYFFKNQDHTSATSAFCVTETCLNADKEYRDAIAKASEARAAANSLQGEINRLNVEIVALEAGIKANEAIANELKSRIILTEQKLKRQEQSLANLLVEMHLEKPANALKILAGSRSISDFAERQSRKDNIKNQIAIVAKEIKRLRDELVRQKAQIDAIIKDQEQQRAEIVANRNRQAELMQKYRNDSAAYDRDAGAARKLREAEIEKYRREYLASLGLTGTIVDPGLNSYPKASQCPGLNWRYTGRYEGAWGGYYCECTSYAGWKAREYWGTNIVSWGDAKNWGNKARALGYEVLTYAEAKARGRNLEHSIGYWTSGPWGHVVWIEMDYGNGTVAYSEYNGAYVANFSYNTGRDRRGGYTNNASKFRYIFLH